MDILPFLLKKWRPSTFIGFILPFFQKKSAEGGKQGAPFKKLKKDKVGVATGKSSRTESSTVTTAPRVKPELPLPAMYSSILFQAYQKKNWGPCCVFPLLRHPSPYLEKTLLLEVIIVWNYGHHDPLGNIKWNCYTKELHQKRNIMKDEENMIELQSFLWCE